jgi:hypothetical protein
MDSRRAGRPSQVRPRPPSTGHRAPVKARPVAPSPTRLARHRQIERRAELPLVAKGLLALAVVALGASILWVGSGGIGPFVAAVADGFSGMIARVGGVVASQSPSPPPAVSDAPTVVAPDNPYTNIETVDMTITVPPAVVGQDGYIAKLWVTLPDKARTEVTEVPVGPTSTLVIPAVTLASGRNDFQASIMGPGGESELSAITTWVLDNVKPKITITSPKDNATVAKSPVTIKGKTQAGSSVVVRNDANGATASTDADQDGLFQVAVAIGAGSNALSITVTDPAGNVNSKGLTVRKGAGKLLVNLTGSAYRFKASKLPANVTFTVTVTGPDGAPVADATVLFTVTVPGLEAIVSGELPTGSDGTASFSTRIPKGAMAGSGLASVLVTTTDYGTATDRQVLTVQ